MAQWMGQYSGLTHETKVQDLELSLRQAIKTIGALPAPARPEKLKALRHLAGRLLAARLKAVRARVAALTEPGRLDPNGRKASQLQARAAELQAMGPEDVLKEFGFDETSRG
ncbi:MAG: hypothetical protein EBS05_23665 [Proteobacteria bacterium]|nr:hypothetical protein [Pseudomonadota bacterium]